MVRLASGDQGGDVPGVVLAAVVPALEGQPSDRQCLGRAGALAQAMRLGEHRLGIDVNRRERVRGAGRLALAEELLAVVVAPACPRPGSGMVLNGQGLAPG